MSRQQALADEIRRARHDELIKELRLRQRNIVFPDTVRNWGVFLRNLASKSIHAYTSHRIFALFFGFYMLMDHLAAPLVIGAFHGFNWLDDLVIVLLTSLWIALAIKIVVNTLVREDRPKLQLPKTYPNVKI
jgi:hypothetical protein